MSRVLAEKKTTAYFLNAKKPLTHKPSCKQDGGTSVKQDLTVHTDSGSEKSVHV